MGDGTFFHEGRITLADLRTPSRLEAIYGSQRELYWTEDWSPEFYIAQAKAGFIATSIDLGFPEAFRILLPEIQHAYAILDWDGLHLSRSMRRWMASDRCRAQGFRLEVGIDYREVLGGIARSHPDNWMDGRYHDLLAELAAGSWDGFELLPVGLYNRDRVLVAGEMGVRTGRVYTSLTGFLDRGDPDFSNAGKFQLVELCAYLRGSGFAFWNLGHPYMPYKLALGAEIVPRPKFLRRLGLEGGL